MSAILVTGLGLVSPFGSGAGALWETLAAGVAPPPELSNVPGFDVLEVSCGYYMSHEQRAACETPPRAARASDFAIAASRLAAADARIDLHTSDFTIGTVLGSGMGDAQHWRTLQAQEQGSQDFIFRTSDRVGEALELDGPIIEVSTACAAGGYAIALASMLLRAGEADIILCGGADAASFHALAAFNRLGALDGNGCRPFDERRAGTLFGEAAAILVLERDEVFAERGGGRAYARLAGFGMSCDAVHPTAPAENGLQIERAMRATMTSAEVGPDAIGLVIPHATGTQLNDRVESAVIKRVFGTGVQQPWCLPVKAYAGHTGGTSGALSALVAALVLRHGAIPPAPPLEQAPECDVRLPGQFVANAPAGHVLVNAFAFGGANIGLVFGEVERTE